MQETQLPSLGWEDPLEEGMATHFILGAELERKPTVFFPAEFHGQRASLVDHCMWGRKELDTTE